MHCSIPRIQCIMHPPIYIQTKQSNKWWCQLIGGHVSYPIESPTATWPGQDCLVVHLWDEGFAQEYNWDHFLFSSTHIDYPMKYADNFVLLYWWLYPDFLVHLCDLCKHILQLISPWTKWPLFWQMTISNAFYLIKMIEFHIEFHLNLFPEVRLTISQHWFR